MIQAGDGGQEGLQEVRILFTGGGTGGHITPGLAIYDEAKRSLPGLQTLWVGTPERREASVIPREGIRFVPLKVNTIRRSLSPADCVHNLKTVADWLSLRPIVAALRILSRFSPQVILATGGYVCAPVAVAARIRGIPVVLLEQNAALGASVKLLSRMASQVLLAYTGTERDLPASVRWEVIGNPVRRKLLETSREQGLACFGLGPEDLVLLITGGSLGSKALDEACVGALKAMESMDCVANLAVLFHTGEANFPWVQQALAGSTLRIQLFPFLERMPEAMSCADAIVSRAGAMSVAEISAKGIPAVLVPWAGAARDHQRLNSEAVASAGGARVILDSDLSADRLVQELTPLLKDSALRRRMAAGSASVGRPQAAARAVALLKGSMR